MKRTLIQTMKTFAALAFAAVLAMPAIAAKPNINVTLDPPRITLGEAAQLTVSVSGEAGTEPAVPNVDGLEFTPAGQSSQFQSINGTVTASQSLIYLVTPMRAGTFTIPPITVGRGSDAAASRPVLLQVAGNGTTAPQARRQKASVLPSPSLNGSRDDEKVFGNGQSAFLRLVAPKREFYVGELVPVEIKAYFRSDIGAKLNGLPVLTGNAFTVNKLDGKPAQTQEIVDGRPHIVVTWTTALSAVKAGEYPLALEMPVLLQVRERGDSGRGFFGDPFFDDVFGRTTEKPVTLRSEADVARVLELPKENRPAGFAGAVGQFDVSAEASPAQITAGDPITLRMRITGAGNFDRVASSLLHNSTDWKTYKSVARFEPADSTGFQGVKTIEQAVVPTQPGSHEIPPLIFSFFDPEKREYITRKTAPLAVEVSPAASSPTVAPAGDSSGTSDAKQNVTESAKAASRPADFGNTPASNRLESGRLVSSLLALLFQSWILIATGAALVVLAAALLHLHRRRKPAGNSSRARTAEANRAVGEHLTAMNAAIQRADSSAFFAAARRALQHRLGERFQLPPETITLTEINARLNGHSEAIRPIFQMADQAAYGGADLPAAHLNEWQKIVNTELKKLEVV